MQIVVLADDGQRAELAVNLAAASDVKWINSLAQVKAHPTATVLIDLLFVPDKERIEQLTNAASIVIINSVTDTLADTHPSFVRINGWNSFLSSPVVEAATASEGHKRKAEEAFAAFGKTVQWLPDEPGFVTARVVSMIINEAYLALGEGISTKEEINTAMKLGTAYPYGPFEWGEKIGVQRVANLLKKLAQQNPRYEPATLLDQPTQL